MCVFFTAAAQDTLTQIFGDEQNMIARMKPQRSAHGGLFGKSTAKSLRR
jgi:hypothetical protein